MVWWWGEGVVIVFGLDSVWIVLGGGDEGWVLLFMNFPLQKFENHQFLKIHHFCNTQTHIDSFRPLNIFFTFTSSPLGLLPSPL